MALQCEQMRSPSQSLINILRHFKHRRCSLSCWRSGSGFSLLWRSANMLMESGFQNSFIPSAWRRFRSGDIPPSALGHLRQRRRPPRRDGSRGSPTGREDGRSSRAACHGFLPRSEFLNATTVRGRRPSPAHPVTLYQAAARFDNGRFGSTAGVPTTLRQGPPLGVWILPDRLAGIGELSRRRRGVAESGGVSA